MLSITDRLTGHCALVLYFSPEYSCLKLMLVQQALEVLVITISFSFHKILQRGQEQPVFTTKNI